MRLPDRVQRKGEIILRAKHISSTYDPYPIPKGNSPVGIHLDHVWKIPAPTWSSGSRCSWSRSCPTTTCWSQALIPHVGDGRSLRLLWYSIFGQTSLHGYWLIGSYRVPRLWNQERSPPASGHVVRSAAMQVIPLREIPRLETPRRILRG
jgi:hypothetical protein